MSNILLASNNAVDSGATWYGDQDSSPFVLTQLADPNFSKIWRKTPGTNADGNTVKFAVSLGTIARLNHLALCRHNLSEAAQIRVRAGLARLDLDFTDDTELTSPYLTFANGTGGTYTNEYGNIVTGACPRYECDRRYFENGLQWSEDLSNTVWATSIAKAYPDGKTVAFESTAIGQAGIYQLLQPTQSLYADTYEMKAQVRLVSGDGTFLFQIYDGQSFIQSSVKTATADWQWFSAPLVSNAAATFNNAYAYIMKGAASGVLQIRKVQVRRGLSNGKYRKTTTQRRYQRRGLVTESGNTNGLKWSTNFANAAWLIAASATKSTSPYLSPDGVNFMTRLTGHGTAGDYIYQDFAGGGTVQFAASVYFHLDAGADIALTLYLQWIGGTTSGSLSVSANARTGALGGTSVTGPATLLAAGVKDEGNGFYRLYIIGYGTDATNNAVRSAYQIGNSATGYIDVWGGQTEFTYVTSLIPTTTSAAARNTDTAKVEASTWVPYVLGGQVEGTVYTEAMVNEIKCDTLRGASTIQFSDAGGTNHIDLYAAYTANDNFQYSDVRATYGGVAEVDLLEAAAAKGAVSRMAMHWRPNDYTAYMNGQGMGQDVGSDTFSAFTVIDLMYQPTSTAFLRRIAFWMTGKTTADLQAMSNSGPSAIEYDSGWSDALQMTPYTQLPALWGYDYDIIKSFTDRAVEWIRVGIYDPAKTSSSTPFEIGRLFTGKVKMQPGVNPSYGLSDGWDDATTYAQTQSRRRIFNVLPKLRQVAFELGKLSLSEGDAAHEFDGTNGLSTEVLYLPDPSDEAKCQRYGFVGLMETLDALRWPLMNLRSKAYQITDKR
jgi:hypothetical protein